MAADEATVVVIVGRVVLAALVLVGGFASGITIRAAAAPAPPAPGAPSAGRDAGAGRAVACAVTHRVGVRYHAAQATTVVDAVHLGGPTCPDGTRVAVVIGMLDGDDREVEVSVVAGRGLAAPEPPVPVSQITSVRLRAGSDHATHPEHAPVTRSGGRDGPCAPSCARRG